MLLAHVAEQDVLQELVYTFSSPKHVVLHVLCAAVVLSHVLETCEVFYIADLYSMQSLMQMQGYGLLVEASLHAYRMAAGV